MVQSGFPHVFDNKPGKYKFLLLCVLSCGTTESWVPPQYLANLCRNPIYLQHLWHGDLSYRSTLYYIWDCYMHINKNCSKITVIKWHAVSHSSKSIKVLEIVFSCVRLLEDSIKSTQGRTNGRAGELRRIKRSLIDKFFYWKRLSLDICFL